MPPVSGKEVQRLRIQLGLKQTELAAELGVHPITVSKWETGVHAVPEPAAKLLRLLANMARTKKAR